jgi:Macrocin-O-methyltransferase (TylF)
VTRPRVPDGAHKRPWYRRMISPILDAVAKRVAYTLADRIYYHDSARRLVALAEGAEYAARHMQGAVATPATEVVLFEGLKVAPAEGLFAEFGVWRGSTINTIAEQVGERTTVHGFDSFEGLPEDWHGPYRRGLFHMKGQLPKVRANVKLHPGWFNVTVPQFAAEHPATPIAFLHVDCDLYSSTKTIFDGLGDRLRPGSVIVFDEYFNYPGWREHEYKAFQELVSDRSLRYRYVAYNSRGWNAAVQITE